MEMAVGSFEAIEVEGLGCSQEGFGLCDEGEREKEFVGCFLSPVAATVTRGKVGGGNLREMSLARARPRSWLTLSKRTVTSLAETPIRRLPPVTPLHEMDKEVWSAVEVRQKAFEPASGLHNKQSNFDVCRTPNMNRTPGLSRTPNLSRTTGLSRTKSTARTNNGSPSGSPSGPKTILTASSSPRPAAKTNEVEELTKSIQTTLSLQNSRERANKLSRGAFQRQLDLDESDWQRWLKNYFRVEPSVFRERKEDYAEILSGIFDEHVTDGKLSSRVSIEWNKRFNTTAGMTYFRMRKLSQDRFAAVVLSTKVLDSPMKLYRTLAHEFCHAAQWIIDATPKPPHGATFKSWVYRFRDFDPTLDITTCHQYEIDYKYRYECESCHHVYGRHSKSIDVKKKVCGNCRGKLQLLPKLQSSASIAAKAKAEKDRMQKKKA